MFLYYILSVIDQPWEGIVMGEVLARPSRLAGILYEVAAGTITNTAKLLRVSQECFLWLLKRPEIGEAFEDFEKARMRANNPTTHPNLRVAAAALAEAMRTLERELELTPTPA